MRLSWPPWLQHMTRHLAPLSPEVSPHLASAILALPVALVAFSSTLVVAGCAKAMPGAPSESASFGARSSIHRVLAPAANPKNARTAQTGDFFKLASTARSSDGSGEGTDVLGRLIAGFERNGGCPQGMASIEGRYCIDRYEASLVEVLPSGEERIYPYFEGSEGHTVRAVSVPGVKPQAHISEAQAIEACGLSGKRLCKPAEWRTACMGPQKTTWGYGTTKEVGRCNDHGRSPIGVVFPQAREKTWGWNQLNNSRLNQVEGTLAATGSHPGCTNGYGVFDMVGNLHEWVDDPKGTFQGGYYQDTHINGDGCGYRTTAHNAVYYDYSTGFRCCADAR